MMRVIERKRNSGKTTILLHYMVCNPNSVYVGSTEAYAKRVFEKAKGLGLGLPDNRFKSMADKNLQVIHSHGYVILADDIDAMISRNSELGLSLAGIADIVTVNSGGG